MIHARVQHHPSRAELLPALVAKLGMPTEVIRHASEPPNPWLGYQKCLTDLPACSHVLVVQDDALPVRNFATAVQHIALANPDTPVVLFFPPSAREKREAAKAMKLGARYMLLRQGSQSFMSVVAALWPRHKAIEFLEWAAENPELPGQKMPFSDDAMAGRWKTRTRQTVRVCLPSIVEHDAGVPSLVGNDGKGGRRAMFLAEDAMAYDWS